MRIHTAKVCGQPVTAAILAFSVLAVLSPDAQAACTTASNGNASCSGTITTPLTIYDEAALFQPVLGGNSYVPANPAFPAASNPNNPGYNPNPPTVNVTLDSTANFTVVNPATSFLADKALIVANYSNNEDPAVNNVNITNAGTVSLSTNQIASRMDTIVGDSQVNNFVVNNNGTIAITQTFFGSTFNPANLGLSSSGTPPVFSATYGGATLNDMAATYSDDNTNEFVINNAQGASLLATGNYASGYYGRADTTITNSGTIANTSWTSADTLATGHWAIATWAGADFEALPNTSPDSPTYVVSNQAKNSGGNLQGTIQVEDTSATTLTNNASGTIQGDILAIDTTPLVQAAAIASNHVLPVAISGTNAGPRDSNIENYGLIDGNFYLGSGTHVVDNGAGGIIVGSVNVDQRPAIATFAVADVFSTNSAINGTPLNGEPAAGQLYLSAGGTDFAGNTCSAANASTTDAGCAKTTTVLATYVGGQSFTLTNEGTLAGNIVINDQPNSVNSVTLTGAGFLGSVTAVNGTGSNTLILNNVPRLASISNFSSVQLGTSNVIVPGGVTMPTGGTLMPTIYGIGGTSAAPSSNTGAVTGTLTFAGPGFITPVLAVPVQNGAVYQIASNVVGASKAKVSFSSALVGFTTSQTGTGALLLTAAVQNPAGIAGISRGGAETLTALINYTGDNANAQTLSADAESIADPAGTKAFAEQVRPDVSGASDHVLIDTASLMQAQIDQRMALVRVHADPASGDFADSAIWVSGFGYRAQDYQNSGIDPYSSDATGAVMGIDYSMAPDVLFGGAVGYVMSAIDDKGDTQGDRTNIDSYRGMFYADLQGSPWRLDASLAAASNHYTAQRIVNFAALGGGIDTNSGQWSGMQYTAALSGSYPMSTGAGTLAPVLTLTYNGINQNAYSETSTGISGLDYASGQFSSFRSSLGPRYDLPMPLFGDLAMDLEAAVFWTHELGDNVPQVNAGFQDGGPAGAVHGAAMDRDMLDLNAEVSIFSPGDGESVSLGYRGEIANSYSSHAGMLRARIMF